MRNNNGAVKIELLSDTSTTRNEKNSKNKKGIKEEHKTSDEGISSRNSRSEDDIQRNVSNCLSSLNT